MIPKKIFFSHSPQIELNIELLYSDDRQYNC